MKSASISIAPLAVHGALTKMGVGVWDMAREWRGPQLTMFTLRESLWDKGIHIEFRITPSTGVSIVFALTLSPPMTEEEVQRTGEVYMTLLNLRNLGT